jgi:hypothetical protein
MITRRPALVVVLLGLAVPARGQELKQDGILKNKAGSVAAALAFAPGDRVVAAYVAQGTEGDKAKLMNWAEVRLLDVTSGKYLVLVRAAAPAALPGIGANYKLLGFTADGKKVAVSTSDPGGTTLKLLLDIPDFEAKQKEKTEKGKVEDSKK